MHPAFGDKTLYVRPARLYEPAIREKTLTTPDKRRPSQDRATRIIQALAWPAVAISALVLFRGFVAPKEISLDGRGVKISFFLLQAAELPRPGAKEPPPPPDTTKIVRTAQRASSLSLSGANVLWVDDNPDNNRYEREALFQLGLQLVIATSTAEALQQLGSQPFRAVITDFARKDDPEGAYTILAEVKKISPTLPVIIYTGSVTPEQETEAKRRGAYGETNSPVALFDLVIDAIKGR